MKLYNIFLVSALGLMAAACAEDVAPSIPQANPQEPIFSAENGVVSKSEITATSITLTEDQNIPVVSLETTDGLPEGAYVSYQLDLSKTPDFATHEALALTKGADNNTFYVSSEAWNSAQIDLCGLSVKPQTLYYRIPVYVNINGSDYRYNSVTYFAGEGQIASTRIAPDEFIDDEYLLIANGVEMKFNHSAYDAYDDPNFRIAFSVSDAQAVNGFEWHVVPASYKDNSAYWYGVSQTGNPTDLNGELLVGGAAGVINTAENYVMAINMRDLTYTINVGFENLYTPGDSNGWNFAGAQMLYTNDYMNYYGYAHLSGTFKFTSAPNWDGVNFGQGGEEGELSTDGGSGNLSVAENALYWCHVNTSSLTYDVTEITSIGLIGSATPGGWDSETKMTASADFLTYTLVANLTGGEYKFRANDDWAINLGGSLDDLTQDGANLRVEEAGTYKIELNLSSLPYTATLTKQ